MNQHIILSALGADRPGLVDEVSEFILERGGNIEDSRMVNLRGQFAIMMLIAGTDEALRRIGADAQNLSERTGLHAETHPAAPPATAGPTQGIAYRLTATALDQSGLVHRLAHVLREQGVNIESLDTRLQPAPYTGAPMFEMELIVTIPRTTPLSRLREQLTRTCDEMNIDWQFEPV